MLMREKMYAIEEFDNEAVDEIRSRVNDVLIAQAIGLEELLEESESDPIETLEGMNDELLKQLKQAEIITWDDLAELSVDELVEITTLDDKTAGELIIRAREPWFSDND